MQSLHESPLEQADWKQGVDAMVEAEQLKAVLKAMASGAVADARREAERQLERWIQELLDAKVRHSLTATSGLDELTATAVIEAKGLSAAGAVLRKHSGVGTHGRTNASLIAHHQATTVTWADDSRFRCLAAGMASPHHGDGRSRPAPGTARHHGPVA